MMSRIRYVLCVYRAAVIGFCATLAVFSVGEKMARAADPASGAFKAEVLALVKRERPTLSATDTGEPETIGIGDWTLGLINLFRAVRDVSGKEREGLILAFIDRAIVPSELEFASLDSAAPMLRVQIVPSEWVVESSRGEKKLVGRPLSSYIAVAYALDEPHRMGYLNEKQFASWKTDVVDVDALAVANLESMSADIPVDAQGAEGEGRFWVHYFDDGYGVARILCPEFVKRLRIALGEKFFVGLPNRDILIAWSPDWSQKVEFAEQIRSDFGSEPHPRSPEIFAIDAGGLRLATSEELRAHGR